MKKLLYIFGLFLMLALVTGCQKYEVIGPEENVEDVTLRRETMITDQIIQAEEEFSKDEKQDYRIIIEDDDDDNGDITDDDDDDDDEEESQDKAEH